MIVLGSDAMADYEKIAATLAAALLHGREFAAAEMPAEVAVSTYRQVLAALQADHPYRCNKPSWANALRE
jgi:hypothetical protein